MTKAECLQILAYIEAGIQKPLSKESATVYCDMLSDLPKEALQVAAKRVLTEHRWATYPSIAELRQAASETIRGVITELTPAKAWEIAWGAAKKIDLELDYSLGFHTKDLPDQVVEAMKVFGITALVNGKSPVEVMRGQFLKIFEQIQAGESRKSLLPGAVVRAVEEIGKSGRLPAPVQSQVNQIGKIESE